MLSTEGVYRRTYGRDHISWWMLRGDGDCASLAMGRPDFSCRWTHRLASSSGTWRASSRTGEFEVVVRVVGRYSGENRYLVRPGSHGGIAGAWFTATQTVTGEASPGAFYRFEPLSPDELRGSVKPLVRRVRTAVDAGDIQLEAVELAEAIGEGIASKVLGHPKPRARRPTKRTMCGIADAMLELGPETVARAAWCLVDRGEESWRRDAQRLLAVDRSDPDAIDAYLRALTVAQVPRWASSWTAAELGAHLEAACNAPDLDEPDPFALLRGGLSSWLLGIDDPLIDASLPVADP